MAFDLNGTFAVSCLTLVGSLGQAYLAHRKGKKAKVTSGAQQNRMEDKLNTLEKKLDACVTDQQEFIVTTLETFSVQEKRLDGLQAHVIGPDGKNGLRSRVQRIEDIFLQGSQGSKE